MYCLVYQVKKRFSGSIRCRYVKLKKRAIMFRKKESAEQKLSEIKKFINESNGLYLLYYSEIKEYVSQLDREQLDIQFDINKIFFEEFIDRNEENK